MRKLITLILMMAVTALHVNAQLFSVTGIITDKQNQSLPGANVVLLNPTDSALLKGSVTDTTGFFEIARVASGKYILKISFIGFRDKYLNKEITGQSLTLGKIILQEKATTLNEADVTGQVLPAQMKGDTTQYNADAFKTNKDATSEDLVTKMPGITVQDGKVQAQGEDVKKVTVDGRPFFGDDPNAVLKNLPAEVIDKIQVFDKKSDQSQFTGFDDGNSSKTINIVTKPQFRNGTFGKIYGGYGTDDKWKGGFNLNFFKDKRRISLLANTNNINEQNFSAEDLLGVIGTSGGGNRGQGQRGGFGGPPGQGGRGGRQGGQDNGASNFLVDQKNGITTTHAFGINYADKWGNLDFTGSYFFNYTENNAQSDLFRTYVTQQNAGFTYNEKSKVESKNINHRANLKFELKIDSLNSILFQPKFSAQINDGSSLLYGENRLQDNVVSSTSNDYSSNLTGINFSAPILYRHSFLKKGRSFSLNLTPGYNQNKGISYLNSYTDYYDTLSTDTLNQLANLNAKGNVLSSNATYTEPINDKSQLMFTYTNNYNSSNSSKETYNFSPTEENYNAFDTTLSNKFNSNYFANSVGTAYQYQKLKLNLTLGIAYQNAQLKSTQDFPYQADVNKIFNSWLPNAMLMYKISMQKNLRINYRSNNNAPSVTQLQNVINNSNPLQLTTGNPDLQQDWQNNLNIRYSVVNTAKSTSFFTFGGITYTNNYIANSVYYATSDTMIAPEVILSAGSQITRPVNLDGYLNARLFSTYSLPIKKIKCNLNLNLGGSYSRTPGLINYETNYANSTAVSGGLALTSNISDKVDFTISSNTTYNNIANTLQTASNSSSYVNYNSRFKIQVMPYKGLVLQSDITHQFYNGLSDGYNQNYFLWNAGIGYKFMKNKVAELRLTVFDILKQNNSITRNTTETYYEDVQSNVLQRYFMLTFTYNLKFFKGVNSK
ncbi:MAG: TonB-dependent receptor [Bacteroidia bacterium]